MRKRRLIVGFICLAVFLAVLCGCSSYRGIYAAYEAAGYEAAEAEPYAEKIASLVGEDYADVSTVHLLVKREEMALILEFHSEDEMNDRIAAREVLKELLNADRICGNCVLLDSTERAAEIFRNSI